MVALTSMWKPRRRRPIVDSGFPGGLGVTRIVQLKSTTKAFGVLNYRKRSSQDACARRLNLLSEYKALLWNRMDLADARCLACSGGLESAVCLAKRRGEKLGRQR